LQPKRGGWGGGRFPQTVRWTVKERKRLIKGGGRQGGEKRSIRKSEKGGKKLGGQAGGKGGMISKRRRYESKIPAALVMRGPLDPKVVCENRRERLKKTAIWMTERKKNPFLSDHKDPKKGNGR